MPIILFFILFLIQLTVNGVDSLSVLPQLDKSQEFNWKNNPNLNLALPTFHLTQTQPNPRFKRWTKTGLNVPVQALIVGGGEVYEGEPIPYQLSFLYKHRHICGGVIYTETIALTAAHCLNRSQVPTDYFVRAGGHNLFHFEDDEQVVHVHKIQIHPNYNKKTLKNDIAIIFLNPPLQFNQFVNKVRILDSPSTDFTGWKARVSGWGRTSPKMMTLSVVLREVELFILASQVCREAYGHENIPETALCAGSLIGRDVCNGDSGGPLVVRDYVVDNKKEDILVGLVSWGHEICGTEGYPGVYTKVAKFVEWIRGESEGKKFAKFFEHPNFQGKSYRGELVERKCQNLPQWIDNFSSSIDPEGNCVIIYDDIDCKGSFTRIDPAIKSKGHTFLSEVGMGDVISSFRKCSLDEVKNSGIYVNFYEHPNSGGKFHRGVLNRSGECHNIPAWLNNLASSVNTDGHCVMAYDDPNCEGSVTQFQPGSWSHNRLGAVGMDDRISSYRRCTKTEQNVSTHNYIRLYEHPNEKGKFYRGPLGHGECQNLPKWIDNYASSIHTEHNCVIAFDDLNCQGSFTLFKGGSRGHFFTGDVGLGDRISSYRKCTEEEEKKPNVGHTRFYELPNFGGKFWRGELGVSGECKNVPGWINDLTSSVNTEDNCVVMYEDKDCKGSQAKIDPITLGHHYTSEVHMDNKISSYHRC